MEQDQHSASIIETIGLTKQYGALTAVDDLNLRVPPGICFGLLGPNGAGKTTLIEIIEDIIPATSGEVRYQGRPRSATFREQIGIMFQQTALLSYMSVTETLETFQALYRSSHRIDDLIDLCHLGDIRNQQNDKISGGQRQRLLLALALINRPNLVFLDEPSTGLDPQSRRNLWDIVDTIKAQGKTIVLTTHYMEEAEHLCDIVAIMEKGRIIAQDTTQALIRRHGGRSCIQLPDRCVEQDCSEIPLDYHIAHGSVRIEVDDVNKAVAQLLKTGVNLDEMKVQSPNLEAVFLNLTGRQLKE